MLVPQEDVCNHMKVVVRVRPENQKEKAVGFYKVVQVVDEHLVVFDPKDEEDHFFHGKKTMNRDITKRKRKDLKFVFDAVFDENSSQSQVFEHTTKPVLDGFLNGYNCTVLAYGATGAGKTHTMLGSPEEPGVMYLTMLALYQSMDQIKDEKLCSITVSYLEVYNEQIRDLLTNSGPLAVREDAQRGVVVQGLTLHEPKTSEEILQLLDDGNKNRTQHPTDVNATSSRSHAVFQIYLRQQDKTASINQNVRIAKMCLIDLAGSERASATNARGSRFREGANINQSLLALGNVINALADGKKKNQHIPYRNSKLTRLLKDSLGGNCQTIMIAAVSPSSMFYDDTYNTLKYANRAKDIKSSLKSNVVSLDNHITQYVKICNEQKKEIIMLKEKLKAFEEQKIITHENNKGSLSLSDQEEAEILRFRGILTCLFRNREEIRQEYLNLEMLIKENELKTFYQLQYYKQIEMMCSEDKVEKATCKRDHKLGMLQARRFHLGKKREEEMKRFHENTNQLHQVEKEMCLLNKNGLILKELSKDIHDYHLKLEIKDLKMQNRHVMNLASLQEQQHKQTESLLNALLPVLRKQHRALKEAGLASSGFESDFKEIEHLVERKKTVAWADQTLENSKQADLPEITTLMTFPKLESVQSISCRTPSDGSSEKVQPVITQQKPPSQKRTRRKLIQSPLMTEHSEGPKLSNKTQLNDSFTQELQAIVYTPENCRKSIQNLSSQSSYGTSFQEINSLNTNSNLFHAPFSKNCIPLDRRIECVKENLESTFVIHEDTSDTNGIFSEKELEPNGNDTILPRLSLPSLLTKTSVHVTNEIPSYMAMTAAAKRKRKLTSPAPSSSLRTPQDPVALKRIRKDLSSQKYSRINRPAKAYKRSIHELNPGVQRKFGRSISEGNVTLSSKSKPSSFIKPNFLNCFPKKD
ncbi:kinesin-like protein KIF18A isoform X2 [Macrotis lagotis]|uniref:kinesin-like protein KIF18A isoform X2 n=1 Tax=Macrotis lagotis TaxID=92651 RepID=UPI003D683DF6